MGYNCPDFTKRSSQDIGGGAFCWCGLPKNVPSPPPFSLAATISGIPPKHSHCEKPDHYKKAPHGYECCKDQHDCLEMKRVGGEDGLKYIANKCMHHIDDCKTAKDGASQCKADIKACSANSDCADTCVCKYASCVAEHTAVPGHPGFSMACSTCVGKFMECSADNCAEECACWKPEDKNPPKACKQCQDKNCESQFHHCACGQSTEKFCGDAFLSSNTSLISLFV